MSTSFYQYHFCTLCKVNHKQRKKKHVYSQRHQLVLENVLSKFRKKITEAWGSVEKPSVHAMGWEAGARVWCYFCQTEVCKHQRREECVVASAAFLTHLASPEHTQKMHTFFWENLIPADKKDGFFVSSQEMNRFMENAEQAVVEFQRKETEKLVQETERIRAAERRSQDVMWAGQQQEMCGQQLELVKSSLTARPGSHVSSASSSRQEAPSAEVAVPVGKKTVFAVGQGLTCITLAQTKEESEGNIYTGATPPWLMEEDEEKGGEIGPTAQTFAKHLERLKKQKLPAGRVGATFNHKVDTTAQWLPAFGRVWNHGRRLNSQQQFLKERSSRGLAAPSSVPRQASSTASSSQSSPSPSPGSKDEPTQSWLLEQRGHIWQPTVRCDSVNSLDESRGQGKRHAVGHELNVNGLQGVVSSSLPGSGLHTHSNHRHYPQVAYHISGSHTTTPSPSRAQSETLPASHFSTASATLAPFPSEGPPILDETNLSTQGDSGMYQSVSLGAESPPPDGEGDGGMFEGCRPYKRRRAVTSAQARWRASLIPITPALLHAPHRSKLAKKS